MSKQISLDFVPSIPVNHDDAIKWKHFPRYWPFVRGIHRSPRNSPHKGQWRGALMFVCFQPTVEQKMETPVSWDAIALKMTSLYWISPQTLLTTWTKNDLVHCRIYASRAVFIFGTACQIYCYGRYCVRRSVSPQVPENPSGPLVDNFIVLRLPCVAFGVACVKLLPGVDRWNSLDDPRVIGPCHCEVWEWPRH